MRLSGCGWIGRCTSRNRCAAHKVALCSAPSRSCPTSCIALLCPVSPVQWYFSLSLSLSLSLFSMAPRHGPFYFLRPVRVCVWRYRPFNNGCHTYTHLAHATILQWVRLLSVASINCTRLYLAHPNTYYIYIYTRVLNTNSTMGAARAVCREEGKARSSWRT